MKYSFIQENFLKKLLPKDCSKFVNYAAAGGLVGGTTGGAIGFLYGVKVYESKRRTLDSMDERIMNPETSAYNRRQLIDAKNMIMSMSESEYRNYIVKDYYQKGAAIGSTLGTTIGAIVGKK